MTPPFTPDPAAGADALLDLARLALTFAAIDRTGVYLLDGHTRESDTDHTVMLGWVATAFAAQHLPHLDLGLVAQFALVHDAVEVYAGDTPTLRIDPAGRVAKASREAAAADRIRAEFAGQLPWFPDMIRRYEAQQEPEARYVRGMDKVMPGLVHLLAGCRGLVEQDMDAAELAASIPATDALIADLTGAPEPLMAARRCIADRMLAALTDAGRPLDGHDAAPPVRETITRYELTMMPEGDINECAWYIP